MPYGQRSQSNNLANRDIRAAFVREQGGVELRTIEAPALEHGSIMVKMRCSGICGTDLEKLTGGYTASTILGHEVSGIIAESRSEEFEAGENVVPHHHVACGECYYCQNNAETMCQGFRTSNFIPGGFADEFKVPNYNVAKGGVHRFKKISFLEASFAEPLGCCIRGLRKVTGLVLVKDPDAIRSSSRENFTRGLNNALVVGAGPIGLLHMELLRSQFEGLNLVAVDVSKTRLDFAEKFENATPVLPSNPEGSFAKEARELAGENGFDLVIVATGNATAFDQAVECVRKSGSFLLFGAARKGSTFSLDIQSMLLNELSMTSSYATTEREIDFALFLLESGRIDVKKFVTSEFCLNEIDKAMKAARNEGQVKVIVKP
jgi:L-iditol 2-dehydrogenase